MRLYLWSRNGVVYASIVHISISEPQNASNSPLLVPGSYTSPYLNHKTFRSFLFWIHSSDTLRAAMAMAPLWRREFALSSFERHATGRNGNSSPASLPIPHAEGCRFIRHPSFLLSFIAWGCLGFLRVRPFFSGVCLPVSRWALPSLFRSSRRRGPLRASFRSSRTWRGRIRRRGWPWQRSRSR